MWRWRSWNLAVVATWLVLQRDGLAWLVTSLGRDGSELHLALLAAIGVLLTPRVRPASVLAALSHPPRSHLPALALWLGALSAQVLQAHWLPANPLLCLWGVLGTCGLVGLYTTPGTWRRSLPVWLLLACIVPTSLHLDVYLGFPARKLTAQVVAGVLDTLGVAHVDTGTVLLTESRAAYVDLPCSGVKSLWTTAVFLLAATGLTRRRIDGVWLLIAGATTALVLAANAARVAILVVLETVAGWPLVAEVLHRPLGVIGFVTSCGIGAALLLRRPQVSPSPARETAFRPALAPSLVGICLLAGLTLPGETAQAASPLRHVPLPPTVVEVPISEGEREFAVEQGGAIAKGSFAIEGLTGSAVFVTSRSWRAQHLPEHCLEAHGAQLSELRPEWIDNHAVRFAQADHAGAPRTALWWFQSRDSATDDYTARIWADLSSNEPWVLVSLLLDGHLSPSDPALQRLVRHLGGEVRQTLKETP